MACPKIIVECQRQSFPCSFRLSRDAKYTDLEAVYQGFFICLILSRQQRQNTKNAWNPYDLSLQTVNFVCKLKFPFTLSAEAPCCCLFFAFSVCHLSRDSFTNTAQEGGPEHIPDHSKYLSPFCGLLKNSRNASKVAQNMLFAPKRNIL